MPRAATQSVTQGAAPFAAGEGEDRRDTGDRVLLDRFVLAGDQSAFARLVDRHGGLVWSVCRRVLQGEHDAEDAFQAVFIVLAHKAASIRKREAVGSWLYGVAYRVAMSQRKRAARRHVLLQHAAVAAPPAPPPSEAAFRELQRLLDEQVQCLPEKYRDPFVLCCLEGLRKSDAARELGLKEGTVASRVHYARKLLERRLARRGVTLTAVLTAVALGQTSIFAAPAAALLQTTTHAALAPAAGANGAGVSTVALKLADNFLQVADLTGRMRLTLFMALAALVLATALAGYDLFDGPAAPEVMAAETFAAPPVALGTPVDEQVLAVAFSRDGRRLVTAGGGAKLPGQLKVWDVAAARELVGVDRIPGVQAVVLSADGKTVVTADRSGRICWRDLDSGEQRRSLPAHAGPVFGLALAPEGDLLATGGADATVKVWDAHGSGEPQVFLGHRDHVQSVAFFRHRRAVVSGSRDGTARIWDIGSGKEVLVLKGNGAAIEALAVAPDDALIATASSDAIRLWPIPAASPPRQGAAAEVAEIAILPGEGRAFLSVAFSPNGRWLAGAGADGAIRLWEVATRQPVGTLQKHDGPVHALAFSSDGEHLASGSADKTAKIWPVGAGGHGRPPITLITSWSATRPIAALAYAPDGNVFAVATRDNTLHIRDGQTGDVLAVMHGHKREVTCVAFAPAGHTVASGSSDGTIQLWERDTGANLGGWLAHAGGVAALAFSADGHTLVSAGADKMVRLWDPAGEKPLGVLEGHRAAVLALAAGSEGRLASGDADGLVMIWDLAGKAEVMTLQGHHAAVRALAYTEVGTLASAGDDAAINVWEPGSGTPRHTLIGHAGPVLALAFAPGQRALVSGGQDARVRVWDPAAGRMRTVLRGHEAAVTALAIHPLGGHLVSGSGDTRLLRWRGTK
jgi:RNA polymerase sigma factor (sigma-70 family)